MSRKALAASTRSLSCALTLTAFAIGSFAAIGALMPGVAQAVAANDLRGTWDTYGSGGGYSGTFKISTMDLSSGAFSGTGDGGTFALKGTESGSSVEFTQSEGSYVATDRATVERVGGKLEMVDGTWHDTNGSGGTFTASLAGSTASTGPSGLSVLCVPSSCAGISVTFPTVLSAADPSVTVSVGCGDDSAEESGISGQRAVAAQGGTCSASVLRNLEAMVNIQCEQHPGAEVSYGKRELRTIMQALTDLSTTDANPSVKGDAGQLSKDPTLAPDAQTTSEVQALVDALSQAAQDDPTDPGLIDVDEALSGEFADPSTGASASVGARSASGPPLNATAALAALTARRASAADSRAFTTAIGLATAQQSSAASGAARLTLSLGVLLAMRIGGPGAPAQVRFGSVTTHPSTRGRTTVVVHPTIDGGRKLRELEIVGLSEPVHVTIQLSEQAGTGPTHRASRWIRVN
jgi:hypothetical protein